MAVMLMLMLPHGGAFGYGPAPRTDLDNSNFGEELGDVIGG